MGHKISAKNKRKEWEETMTPEEVDWLHSVINKVIEENGFECVDNIRAARAWKSSQRRRYMRDRDNGCCGYFDGKVKRFNLSKLRYEWYLIGCNYGH